MRLNIARLSVLITALACAAQSAFAGVEIPFKYRDGLVWIQVSTPRSRDTLSFLLDTGASVSVVDLGTARRLGLKSGDAAQAQGVQSVATGYWPTPMTASIRGVPLPENFLALDLAALGRSCSKPVDGLVGMDFFKGRVVQIDFTDRKIRLLDEAPSRSATLPLSMGATGMLTPVSVNDSEPRLVRVDTGCANALQWVTTSIQPSEGQTQQAVALAAVSVPTAKVCLQIGSKRFPNTRAALHDTEIFPGEGGLLGNEILRQFGQVTVDAVNGRLILGSQPTVRIGAIRR